MWSREARRAFDKAVRRKPLAFAADAVGLWELHVAEGGLGELGAASRLIGPFADVAEWLY